MNKKDIISELEDLQTHGCYGSEPDEIGWYSCCAVPSHKGHDKLCTRIKALNEAIRLIKES